jgi:ribosomal protein S18 acetylase RimI-like enzyme
VIVIRGATERDSIALADFGARSFSDTFAEFNTEENMRSYLAMTFSPERQARELTNPDIQFFIAEHDGAIAGSVKLVTGNAPSCVTGWNPIEIARLYVDKQLLRTGIGSRLMEHCLSTALSERRDVVWLGVWEKNERALAFYHRWGFAVVGSHIFQLGDDPQIDLLMERRLGGEGAIPTFQK